MNKENHNSDFGNFNDTIPLVDAKGLVDPENRISHEDIFQEELKRFFARCIKELPDKEKNREDFKKKIEAQAWKKMNPYTEHVNRLIERTFHPTPIISKALKKYTYNFFANLGKKYDKNEDGFREKLKDPAQINSLAEKIAEEYVASFMRDYPQEEIGLESAAIKSNEKLDAKKTEALKEKILKLDTEEELQKKIDNAGGEEDKDLEKDLYIANKQAIDSLKEEINLIKMEHFDESYEIAKEVEYHLVNSHFNTYSVWIDFDGAKRPEGIMFSIYASLVKKDINYAYSYRDLEEKDKKIADSMYDEFLKIDALIHAFTEVLKNNNLCIKKRDDLEGKIKLLKEERFNTIEKLIEIRNTAELNRKKSGKKGMIFISQQIRFLVRLDNEHVKALRKWQKYDEAGRNSRFYKTKFAQPYNTLRHIATQVADISNLSEHADCLNGEEIQDSQSFNNIVPQIMVANSSNFKDITSLDRKIGALMNEERSRKAEDKKTINKRKTSFTPLFEDEKRLNKEYIRDFLDKLWAYSDQKKSIFQGKLNEVFVAGSDSSRRMGRASAMVAIWNFTEAVHKFNQEKGVDIRLKLGTGEALHRQIGYFDSESLLPMIREKVLSPYENIGEKEQGFLEEKFGKNWQEVLVRKGSGFQWLLEKYPFINSFTMQSRAGEQAVFIEPVRFLEMLNDIRNIRKENFKNIKQNGFPELPKELEEAAKAENKTYLKIVGASEEDEKDENGLLSFSAVVEFFAKKPRPELRDRATFRGDKESNLYEFLAELEKKGINSRAIAGNSAGSFIFMLGLIGMGSMLEKASLMGNEAFKKVLNYIPAKDSLREITAYETIAPKVFASFRAVKGMEHIADSLVGEWVLIQKHKKSLQEEFWRQNQPEDTDINAWEEEEKNRLNNILVPGTRELLQDDFYSKRTILYAKSYQNKGEKIFKNGLNFVKDGSRLLELTRDIANIIKGGAEGIEKDDLDEFKDALGLKSEVEYSEEYLANLITEKINNIDSGAVPEEIIGKILNISQKINKLSGSKLEQAQQESKTEYGKFLKELAYALGRLG